MQGQGGALAWHCRHAGDVVLQLFCRTVPLQYPAVPCTAHLVHLLLNVDPLRQHCLADVQRVGGQNRQCSLGNTPVEAALRGHGGGGEGGAAPCLRQ